MCQEYYKMICSNNHRFDIRRSMVEHALMHGISEAAREHKTTRVTVRKWVKRFKSEGIAGLEERSRAPKSCPHKASRADELRVLEHRKRTPGFGAARLKNEFGLKPSIGAIGRIIREHGLARKPKKKHHKKNDLREVKKQYAPFTFFKMDVKYLNDIPNYWTYLQLGLPRFQYTIVDVRTGAVFLAFAHQYGVLESTNVVLRLLLHVEEHGVNIANVRIQTDGGSEFEGTSVRRNPEGFTRTIESMGAEHNCVPGRPNAQAEAESLHSRIEPEFFDIEHFANHADFWQKIATWQNHYNLKRKNSGRDWLCPRQILNQIEPERDTAIFLLPPVHVDTLLTTQGGYHVPARTAPLSIFV